MPRYAAFLRGVTPMNAKMSRLKQAFEAAGFTDVKTVISSGNVVFGARSASVAAIEKKAEVAIAKHLGQSFMTIVLPISQLKEMLAADPYKGLRVQGAAKRVVTFVRARPTATLELPIERDGASILRVDGGTVFSAYLPSANGPVFMTLLQKTFGKEQTTRTWQTLEKVVKAA